MTDKEYQDAYYVSWRSPKVRYGIATPYTCYSGRLGKLRAKGIAVIEDLVLPGYHEVPIKLLTVLPYGAPGHNTVDRIIARAFKAALRRDKQLAAGVQPGRLFSIGVADGTAWYVITAAHGTKCDVEWRGYGGGDRYTDHHFGWGRKNCPVSDVERYVRFREALNTVFRRKAV